LRPDLITITDISIERHLYYYLLWSIFCTTYKEKKGHTFHSRGAGGLLKLSKFGMGTVRMGTEGGWVGTDPAFTLSVI
jgi:hypothetical protein